MPTAPAAIRLMTWNIHGSVGPDWRCDPERIAALIAGQDPDILALQEVDGRRHLGRRPHAFEWFARALGGHCVEARMVRGRAGRDYGHLLWSRWPLDAARLHALPGGLIEPRGAIEALCRTPFGPCRILSAHFGLLPGDRARQAAFVAACVSQSLEPTLALGDFNEWSSGGGVDRSLRAVLPVVVQLPTWPARRPLLSMDRLYASKGVVLRDAQTDPLSARASDHRAVIADMVMPGR